MQRALRWLLVLPVALGCSDRAPSPGVRDVPVRVGTVGYDAHHLPVMILEEEGGPRLLPIWIGEAEAGSIAAELQRRPSPRPNAHDFAKRLIQSADAEVVRVVVTEVRDGTYYASLWLRANGRTTEIDARPSDAIALALRTGAPILVRETLFERDDEALVPGGDGQAIRWDGASDAQPLRTRRAASGVKL